MRRFLPTPEAIKGNLLLRRLGPRLHEPGLWRLSRRSVARGVAIGLFFGLLTPIAQIPAAIVVGFFARANLWVSAVATLVTNPLTFAPLYYLSYRIGSRFIGVPESVTESGFMRTLGKALAPSFDGIGGVGAWLGGIWEQLSAYGPPLFLGLAILAVSASAAGYVGTMVAWRIAVVLKRRRPYRLRTGS
ncbi:MAG: DUF2062 domain-containing protein [Gammaproteobacteria bacterium]